MILCEGGWGLRNTQHASAWHVVTSVPLRRILSSKVIRHVPGLPGAAFLICPRTPETVRTEAPENLATSSSEVNMPSTKAVLRKILPG